MTQSNTNSSGTITLIGSGEMAQSMGKVHRQVMSRISGPVQAVFIDTPAGFELNADQISAKAVEYFAKYLGKELSVASFKSATSASEAEMKRALRLIHKSNYIFAGPGSPTYAVRNWKDTEIIQAVSQRLATGVHISLASAAAIAVGSYVLPVYEIFKVGEEPRWVDGLDILKPYGLELAIIPHWNNSEGQGFDTRFCFVGEPRMQYLEPLLPSSATILGIDEYTACTIDLQAGECYVLGAGNVTVRREEKEVAFPSGETFSVETLGGEAVTAGWKPIVSDAPIQAQTDLTTIPEDVECDLTDATPFIDLLVEVRSLLRANKAWDLADTIRDQLTKQGITLEDGATETTWTEN
jgi:cyanophycinase-like exopeptidase